MIASVSRVLVLAAWGAVLVLAGGAAVASKPCASAETTAVHELAGQGVGRQAPEDPVRVNGVVTAAFLGAEGLDGFFIQGTGPAPDGKPAGLFVYAPELTAEQRERIEPGRQLLLTGRAGEHRGRPQLEWLEAVQDCGAKQVTPYPLDWPAAAPERLEGVLVRIRQPMVVSGTYELPRYGTLKLTPERRAFRPTNFLPGDGPEDPTLSGARLRLDDGSYRGRPDPIPYLDDDGTRRVGSRVADLTGVLTHAFGAWRLHPTEPPDFEASNPRPEALPPPEAGTVRVAAFNVENYFLTLGERGAASEVELERQRAKLLAAAESLHADVLVLVEMENRQDAPEDFVERLAASTGHPWRLARGGETGSDAIKVSLAYREDRVQPVTETVRDARRVHHRPPPLVGFRPQGGGEPFAVAGIHFKSKTRCPDAGDVDRGQGCWNHRRTEQAEALAEFLGRWRAERSEALPVLIAGDLNAYGGEDPARALAAAGKVDLLAEHLAWPDRYTYVFRGESGYLDHLQAHPALAERVAAVHRHPINADEPRFLEFDGDPGRVREDAYRSSDHDPIAVDLEKTD
ncbi:ExeM/NucH family extracellular endonuclease [Halorhodospira halophila]|uniref:Endonuclease/exonuclease/phosphatase n=1 Tax=Halorhodospira halophila (strain DSM 244 / SL1) TaxID=349124 RepID=A1WXT9_HALHL|nr:ExeM/NucH family extracellular endonuclease [Halorhodospira halophila]ABM62501.1 Endonuclease/exonuclease/phosphatase [Halorhodospira halophila SL1]